MNTQFQTKIVRVINDEDDLGQCVSPSHRGNDFGRLDLQSCGYLGIKDPSQTKAITNCRKTKFCSVEGS